MATRLLLLTASTGAGHLSSSAALREEAEKQGFEVREIDCMDICGPFFRSWFRGGYESMVRSYPWLWGHLYYRSDRLGFYFLFQTAMDWIFMHRLGPIITDYKPDWVVCTHSVPQPRLASLRKLLGFKLVVVVTDIHPHRMWLRGRPNRFCVANDQSLVALRKRIGDTIPAFVTGIPVASAFKPNPSHRLQTPLTILLSAGGIGGGPVVEATREISRLTIPLRLIVLCGSNESAFDQISALPKSSAVETMPVRRIENFQVAEWMRNADLIVGKSGGLTTFESLACGLPFFVLDPFLIPGQEELNAQYLVETGCGIRVGSLDQLASHLADLIQRPERLDEMRLRAIANARPEAARDVLLSIAQAN